MTVATSSALPSSLQAIPPARNSFGLDIGLYDFAARVRRYRLGLIFYVLSLTMVFVGFSSAYIVRRGIPTYEATTGTLSTNWEPLNLPITLLLLNTLMLACASLAIEKVRRSYKSVIPSEVKIREQFVWILLALLLSLSFIVGQGVAWHWLRLDGHFMNSGARTAFFYVLTGTHGLHAVVGIAALAWITIRYSRWLPSHRLLAVDLTAWYLHSMTILWLYLFVFLTIA